MPQFASYPLVTDIASQDKFLIHQDSSASEKTITAGSLMTSIQTFVQFPVNVNSITALRAVDVANMPQGNLATVGGYYTLGDGGGGDFYYNPSSTDIDDGGTVITPSTGAGRWLRAIDKTFNVRWFGAKGDDLNNDFVPIQAAITKAKASTTGTVYFSAGNYRISAVLVVPSSPAGNISFVGDGPNVSTIIAAPGIAPAFNALEANFVDNGILQDNRITITGLGFRTLKNGGTAITVSYGNPAVTQNHLNQSVLIDNVSVKSDGSSANWANGIDIMSAWSCQISNTFISGNPQGTVWANLTGDGIRMRRSCVNSQISNVQVSFFLNAFHWTAEGVAATDVNTEGLTFSNCIFTAVQRGTYIEGNPNAIVGGLPAPRVSGLSWNGGVLDLRATRSGFDLINVQDFMVSNTMIVTEAVAGVGLTCSTCSNGTISNIDFNAVGLGLVTQGICDKISIYGCSFTNTNSQVSFSSQTTNSRSGTGFVVAGILGFANELNAGGETNRVFENRHLAARAMLTADFSTAISGTEYVVPWAGVDFEDIEMWSAANPERLTVPLGVTRIRLTAGIRWEASATGTYRSVKIRANNAAGYYPLNAIFAAAQMFPDGSGATAGSAAFTTGIILVKNINYFEVTVQQNSGGALAVRGTTGPNPTCGSYFQMEIIG